MEWGLHEDEAVEWGLGEDHTHGLAVSRMFQWRKVMLLLIGKLMKTHYLIIWKHMCV